MVMGGVQIGKESEFPFGSNRRCWYLLVYVKNHSLHYDVILGNEKRALETICGICMILNKYDPRDRKVLLFGVWHGKWNTNLFLLDPKKTLEILERRGITCKERKVLEYWSTKLGIN